MPDSASKSAPTTPHPPEPPLPLWQITSLDKDRGSDKSSCRFSGKPAVWDWIGSLPLAPTQVPGLTSKDPPHKGLPSSCLQEGYLCVLPGPSLSQIVKRKMQVCEFCMPSEFQREQGPWAESPSPGLGAVSPSA